MSLEKAMRKRNKTEREFYQTPEICVEALEPFIAMGNKSLFDPCSGGGVIGKVLREHNYNVNEIDLYGRDENKRVDFLLMKNVRYDAIVMNPPFGKKKEFIIHALDLAESVYCLLSMQVANYNDFSREILDLPEYRGRIKMIPKFFMNTESQPGIPKLGGNSQYAWFIFSHKFWPDYQSKGASFEYQIDLIELNKRKN